MYLKGRDFFDLWYLYSVLKTPVNVKIIERKFTCYRRDRLLFADAFLYLL
jgi:hypothetical protein